MGLNSFERSSSSYPFDDIFSFPAKKGMKQDPDVTFEISEVTHDFIKGFPQELEQATISNLVGLAAMNKDDMVLGILDGGLSHYKQGGVVGGREFNVNTQIFLARTPVGSVVESNRFERGPAISATLDGHQLRGISCFIYPSKYTRKGVTPLVLVPKHYGQFRKVLNAGDVCTLQIQGKNNMVKANSRSG
jgi:hypothetical protein